MSDPLDQAAAGELRRVQRRKLAGLVALGAAATAGIVVIEQCAEIGRTCVEKVRDQIREEQKDRPIVTLGSFASLKAELRRRVEECK